MKSRWLIQLLGLILCSLALNFLAAPSASASPLQGLCILVYVRPEHPIAKAISKYFPAAEVGRLQLGAVPRDLEECLAGPYSEVLVIAHGAQLTKEGQWALVYREGARYSLFLNRVFQNSLEALKVNSGPRAKKLRLANCALDEILETYPSLRELTESPLIELDPAPPAPWPLQGSGVIKRSLTLPWLAKSSTCQGAKEWVTDQNSTCRSDSWTGCDRSDSNLACFGTKF